MAAKTATILKLRPSVGGLRCSSCGANARASCNCGAPYVPAGQLAAKALKNGSQKSDRAIADELGVDHKTVSRARKTGGEFSPPEKRTGKDGKAYPAKRTSKKPKPTLQAQVNKMARPPIDLVQGYIVELEAWLDTKPPLPEAAVVTLLNALNLCAESCERLTAQIETQFPKGVRKHEATRIPAQ